jgi:hypothetical protein
VTSQARATSARDAPASSRRTAASLNSFVNLRAMTLLHSHLMKKSLNRLSHFEGQLQFVSPTDMQWNIAGSLKVRRPIKSSSRTRRKHKVSKLKIEHGVSRIKRAKLQTYIDQTASEDIELMAEWSNNETHYIVNELLRFALTQNEDFQKYKAEQHAKPKNTPSPKLALSQVKPSSDADANPPTPSVVPAVRQ